jgi:DHA2 family multidrug resistance protein
VRDSLVKSNYSKELITLFVMITTIMQVMDMTIANVALPYMKGSISATQDQISWVLTSYIIAAAIMTQPVNWFVSRYGRRKIFLVSIIGFTISSMLCGMAFSIEEMVIYRILQGIFGAALVPLSQSTLLDINSKENRGSAMAIWGMGVMVGPIVGPVLGGYLTEYYNWRWVFYINVPLGIIACLGIIFFLPDSKKEKNDFSTIGFSLLSIAIASLQLMLDRGQQLDWFNSHEIVIYFGLTISSLWMFIIHTRYSKNPFISIVLFKDLNFIISVVLIFIVSVIFLATLALLPAFMSLMGYSVLDVGILIAPRGVGTFIAMVIIGKLINKVDPRLLVLLGLILTVIALYKMSEFTTFVPQNMMIITGIINGLGLGFIFVPLSAVAFSTLPHKNRVEATSFFSLVRNIGSSIGVSIVTTLLIRNTQINHAYLSESITSSKFWMMKHYLPQFIQLNDSIVYSILNKNMDLQAMTIGYIDNFKIMMICVIVSAPLILLLRNPHKK